MGIKNYLKTVFKAKNENGSISINGTPMTDFMKKVYNGSAPDLAEITYYTCLKTLSEAMGKLPCYVQAPNYEKAEKGIYGDLDKILSLTPNPYQTAVEFFCYLEKCRNHFGNAYAYIDYDKNGNIKGLYPLDPRAVVLYVNTDKSLTDIEHWYQYTDSRSGQSFIFLPGDLIHLKSWLTESTGRIGKAAREILAEYMTGSKSSQEFLTDLYRNGLTANLAIKYTGNLKAESQKKLIDNLNGFLKNRDNRILPISSQFDLQPLDLKLTDTQFLEIRKYSALQIAAAFGIKPNYLNDYDKSSYSNSAAQNLSFYTDALLYNITAYEMELSRKLLRADQLKAGYRIKFNFSVILRADPAQQASMLSTYVNSGIYTINDARRKAGLPPVPGGDINTVNGSCKRIDEMNGEGGNAEAE